MTQVTHGRSAYVRGCRCDECRSAQREYMRGYFRRRGGNPNRGWEIGRVAREKAAGKPSSRELYPAAHRDADQRRHARKMGATVEAFKSSEVYDRDAWVCGICNEPVDPAFAYPNPLSVSLDHIQPLSLGGAHSRENTRCSHLGCNMKRGNRVA